MCNVIEQALELRPALDRLLSQMKHLKGKNKLSNLKLSSTEWSLLQTLKPMLKVGLMCLKVLLALMLSQNFQHVTKQISESGHPLIADVIPLIDILHGRLEALLDDHSNPQIIRASAAKAAAILNKYYSKTDDSKIYRLCMSKLYDLSLSTSH